MEAEITDDAHRECYSRILYRAGSRMGDMVKARTVVPSEHEETATVVKWWEVYRRKLGIPARALFHVPNEGRRSPISAARLIAEGLRSGTPDLFLAVMRDGKGGLWIEMKRAKGGRLSDAQREALAEYESLGYAVTVAHGASEAITAISEYLRIDAPDAGLMRFLRM